MTSPSYSQQVQPEFEIPSGLQGGQKTLADVYFRFSVLNRNCSKDEVFYFREQSTLVEEHESRIRQFYDIHGSLKGMDIPGFNPSNIPSLELIIRVLNAI